MNIGNWKTKDKNFCDRVRNWHLKFVVFPTCCIDGEIVCLQWVERRVKDGKVLFDEDGFIPTWEYRVIAPIK